MFITQHITYTIYHQSYHHTNLLLGNSDDELEFADMGQYQAPIDSEDECEPFMNKDLARND